MKFKSPLFSLGLIGLWYILVAYSSNPPTGATGGAGQATCNQGGCHTAAQIPYAGGVAITGVPNPVAPNTAYTVTLTAASNAVIGGFELMCLNSSNAQCGTLAAGTGSSVVTAGGKQYVRQDNPVTYAGGTASWTFTWTSPASLTNNNITFYYVSLAANDNGGKAGDNSLTGSFATQLAAAPAPVSATISQQQNITCNGTATGGALATATGGSGSYTYAWSNGSTQQAIAGVTAGTYTVTVTSGASTGTATVTITQPSAISGTAVVNGMITCNTPSVGVSASASGGAGGYTYAWSNNTTGATTTYNTVGVHTVTVTDNSLCQKVTTFTIGGSTQAPTANAGIDKTVTCANPTALLTATGGGTYFWSNGITSASIGVAPQNTTTYTVTVTGSNGCTASDNVVVFVNNAPPTANAGNNVTLNCGTPSATLIASGGVSYDWSNGGSGATNIVSPAFTTTYTVTVTGANGCTATSSVIVTVGGTTPIAANAGPDVTLNCTTPSTTLVATGAGNGSYVWSNGSNNASTTVSPSTTTTYIVTVTNINGCTATDNVVVTVNKTAPVANAGPDQTVTCTVPSVTLTATGGTSYLWNNNITNSATFTPSATNTYTVTATGANGCTATDAVVVTVNKTAPVANAGLDQTVNCIIPSVTLNATGGGTYAWGNGIGNTASITVSPSSTTTYTVTITSSNGCIATDDATVFVDITIPVANAGQGATITVINPTATLTATGGVSYNWSNGAFGATITVSSPGTYTVTVTGVNGCSATDNVTVAVDNMPPLANAGPDKTVTCANPTATLTATGGTSYAWSSSAATTSSISVSPSVTTTYTVTVTGANGVTATDNVTVFVDKVAPTANAGPDVTTTCANPSTTLSATGGSTYIWSNGGTTASINVAPTTTTTYIVTATGTNGCTATDNVVVTPNAGGITANAGADATVTCGNPSATLTGVGNGTLSWGNAGTGATITVSPTSTTTYTLSVTGANGCVASDQVVVFVNNQAPVVAITTIAEKLCTSAATIVTATSPTPNLTYAWSGPNGFTSTAAQFTTSITGSYTVTATNPTNGCQVVQTTTVKPIAPPIALTIASSNQGCNVTCLTPTVTGGTAPFTYSWGNVATAKFCTEIPGTYTVTVSDGAGCTTTASAQVTTSPALIVTTTNTTNATTGQSNGGATILVTGGTPAYTYSWTNVNNQVVGTTAILTGVPAGVYICKVTDATGCIFAQTVLIKEMVATADLDLQRLVSIYPNPAQGECFINLTEATEGIVTFYNLQGQVLLNQTLDQAVTRLDVQDMASGTYMVVVKLDKKMVMKKVVVE
jgi:hypothetical protein